MDVETQELILLGVKPYFYIDQTDYNCQVNLLICKQLMLKSRSWALIYEPTQLCWTGVLLNQIWLLHKLLKLVLNDSFCDDLRCEILAMSSVDHLASVSKERVECSLGVSALDEWPVPSLHSVNWKHAIRSCKRSCRSQYGEVTFAKQAKDSTSLESFTSCQVLLLCQAHTFVNPSLSTVNSA